MQNQTKHKKTFPSNDERLAFRLWLQRQFTERCKRNARYSLRAFAKSLELDPSSLSQILSGTRTISKNKMLNICEKVSTTPSDFSNFGIFKNQDGLFEFCSNNKTLSDSNANSNIYYTQLNLDYFAIISDWYHYAIVELICTTGFNSDPKWIARKLAITVEETKAAIQRLKRVGLIQDTNGVLNRTKIHFTNLSNVNTSSAHRELQKQIIQKALLAVDECSSEEKDITSMTMAIDETNFDQARIMIQNFRRKLCSLLEKGNQNRVYNLAIQLYPISMKQESK
jgi:uncharacterized protein (TIGR02147 family)